MELYYNTVTPALKKTLGMLMQEECFLPFRLVGGTALSLQLGHRISVDIDLFTDADYGAIDFGILESLLRERFDYVDNPTQGLDAGAGKSFFVGEDEKDNIKLDLYYCDPFVDPVVVGDEIRMASLLDVAAMKLDVIGRGGRKKDFWDLHALLELNSLESLMQHYQKRYPYSADTGAVVQGIRNVNNADDDFDPICLHGKEWQLIKLDLLHYFSGM